MYRTKKVLIILLFTFRSAILYNQVAYMKSQNPLHNKLPGTKRTFKSNSPIIYQGEAPRNGYYVVSGIIKAYTLQANGDEQIVGFFGPGDLFPLSWLYGNTSTSIYYHEALEMSQLISVTKQDMDQHVRNNTEVKDWLLGKLIEDQSAYLMRITALEQSRAVEKILFTLYYLLYQFGARVGDTDEYVIQTKLTHATIASLVGLTRETTATELNKLKRKQVLTYSKKQYTVNKRKLENTIGEDSFSEIIE